MPVHPDEKNWDNDSRDENQTQCHATWRQTTADSDDQCCYDPLLDISDWLPEPIEEALWRWATLCDPDPPPFFGLKDWFCGNWPLIMIDTPDPLEEP